MIESFKAAGRRLRDRLSERRAWFGRALGALAFCAAVLTHAPAADAASIPWRNAPITYTSNGKPLKQVLKDILTTQPFPLVIQGEVKGSVHGEFRKPAAEIFRDLEAAYGFVWYFDGAALYVSASDDLRSEIIPVAPMRAEQVAAMLERLGLAEPRFPVRVSGGSAFVTGPKAYVELVTKALTVGRDGSGAQAPAVQGASARQGGGTRATRPAKRKLQIFQLKHAQAWDVRRFIGDREYVIPGIASILRRLAGEGIQAGDYLDGADEEAGGGRTRVPGVLGVADAVGRTVSAGASSGGAYIEADIRTNSVIVRDSAENLQYYAEIVEKLDRPQKLVQLEVTIVDISSTAARDLGTELAARYPGFGRNGLTSSAGGDGFAFQGVLGGVGGQLRLRIAALEKEGQAKVVSQPKILTLDNIEAVLGNEGTAYARVAGAYQTDLYPITAGLLMKITPQVIEGRKRDKVRLFVDIRDGKLDPDTEVDGLPVTTRNVISTQAVVGDGQVFLVGGHRRESSGSQVSGVPGLSKAPVIGGLFRRKGNKNELAERLLMITPRVIAEDAEDEAWDEPEPEPEPASVPAKRQSVAAKADAPALKAEDLRAAAVAPRKTAAKAEAPRAAARPAAPIAAAPRAPQPAKAPASHAGHAAAPRKSIWDGFERGAP